MAASWYLCLALCALEWVNLSETQISTNICTIALSYVIDMLTHPVCLPCKKNPLSCTDVDQSHRRGSPYKPSSLKKREIPSEWYYTTILSAATAAAAAGSEPEIEENILYERFVKFTSSRFKARQPGRWDGRGAKAAHGLEKGKIAMSFEQLWPSPAISLRIYNESQLTIAASSDCLRIFLDHTQFCVGIS